MASSMERRSFHAMLAKLSVGAYVATRSGSLFSDEITQDKLLPNITSGTETISDGSKISARANLAMIHSFA